MRSCVFNPPDYTLKLIQERSIDRARGFTQHQRTANTFVESSHRLATLKSGYDRNTESSRDALGDLVQKNGGVHNLVRKQMRKNDIITGRLLKSGEQTVKSANYAKKTLVPAPRKNEFLSTSKEEYQMHNNLSPQVFHR